jgi:hypothetical protein
MIEFPSGEKVIISGKAPTNFFNHTVISRIKTTTFPASCLFGFASNATANLLL